MSKIDTLLYPYQQDALKSISDGLKGKIIIPTGVGKTFVQAACVINDINSNKGFRMYVINSPRIMLSYQLFNEYYKILMQEGIECRYMFVHSGGKVDEMEIEQIRYEANISNNTDIPFSEIKSGTSAVSIAEMINNSKALDLPLLLFSTYNSADRIEIARENTNSTINICINDEAHYLVQEQFNDLILNLTKEREYFFTATEINTPSNLGKGMNNVNSYGEVLYKMIPRQAIDLGKMIRPRLHFINTDGVYSTDDYKLSLPKIIYEVFYQHKKVLDNKLNPKILISVKGTADIKRFIESDYYRLLLNEGVDIYCVASHEDVKNDKNGEKVSRQEFLKQLKLDGADDSKSLIVLHYDILAEGIDVSGFTGILPLRTMNKAKFLQTYGRAARLHNVDRKGLADNLFGVHDLEMYKKPYSYVIIPNVVHTNLDDKENFINLITELREYGFNPAEDIISSSYVNGIPEIDNIVGLNEIKRKLPNVGDIIENLEADIEAEENSKLKKDIFLEKVLSF